MRESGVKKTQWEMPLCLQNLVWIILNTARYYSFVTQNTHVHCCYGTMYKDTERNGKEISKTDNNWQMWKHVI